jgi:hypothetical protein
MVHGDTYQDERVCKPLILSEDLSNLKCFCSEIFILGHSEAIYVMILFNDVPKS